MGTELEKAIGKVLVDSAAGLRTALGQIFGSALVEFGETLGDKTRFWRFKNLARIIEEAQAIADKRQLSPENIKALPFADSIRVVEAASQEEDETVRALWARLIANATDPAGPGVISKVHVDILKSLSAPEACLLELLSRFPDDNRPRTFTENQAWEQRLSEAAETGWRKFPIEVRDVAIQNLHRLRCVTFRPVSLSKMDLFKRIPRELDSSGKWSVVDSGKFEGLLRDLQDMIGAAAGAHEIHELHPAYRHQTHRAPERLYILTSLGNSLMSACADNPHGGDPVY
jgi:hypothetical protein